MNENLDDLLAVSPFRNANTINELVRSSSLYLDGSPHRSIRLSILVGHNNIFETLTNTKNIETKFLNSKESLLLCSKYIPSKEGNDVRRKIEWVVINFENMDVYLILSFEPNDIFRRYILKPLCETFYRLTISYLSTEDILSIIKLVLDSSIDINVRILKTVARKRNFSIHAERKIASTIEWSDKSYSEVCSMVSESNLWLKSIEFKAEIFKENESYNSIGSIHRDGIFCCRTGFSFFFHAIIADALSKAIRDKKLLEGRSRSENKDLSVRPLIIDFEDNIFADKKENIKLIKALEHYPQTSLSVHHANPYLKAYLTDNRDSSSYDIWVLSEQRIIIVPQLKASLSSLKKLINHLGEHFQEGKVVDFSEIAYE